jgi:hypothetical protein
MNALRTSLPCLALCACSALAGLNDYSASSGEGPTQSGPHPTREGGVDGTDSGDAAGELGDAATGEPVDVVAGDAGDDAGGCASTLTSCPSGCANTSSDVRNCGVCGNTCTTPIANAQATCGDGGCGFACNAGYTLCAGACVDFQTDKSNCGGCGASFACASGQGCQAGRCTSCTSVSLPPSINVDATQWSANFATSPTWACTASGTTTIDSNAGAVTSTSCALGTVDITNNVAQSVSGGPSVMVVRLRGLTVTNGHVLALKGNKPIVLLIAGDVLVDLGGKIDAGARGTTAGPGGSLAANCAGSTGTNEPGVPWGGGGGGFGTAGGPGANALASPAAGGKASTSMNLQPLRGGCGGGTGGGGAGAAGAGGGAFEISAAGTIRIGTGSNMAILTASGGGSPAVTTGQNVGSGGGGSGGGILLASPVAATFGSGGAVRANGGASGASEGCACNPETSADNGEDGHAADNVAAAGGRGVDVNAANGASGGVCAGSGCATVSSSGNGGVAAQVANSASGGGGGAGRVQVDAAPVTMACN